MIRKTPHQLTTATDESGSTLLVALITMAVLTTVAASVFLSSVPAYRGTYQTSAWHEAKLAADAGVDYAMAALQNTAPNPMAYSWPGWTLEDGTSNVPANYDGVRVHVPAADMLGKGDGTSKPRVTRVEVDVITRDTNFMKNAWFRIRSTGLAEVNSSQLGLDKRDLSLRRMTLRKNEITRTIEVLARPVYLWEYALKTSGSMVLGGGSTWVIDSYDSRYPLNGLDPYGNPVTDPRSSNLGVYSSNYSREYGNIASDMTRPQTSPIGMLIDAEGAVVKGEVQTNGGDDPDTETHENVEDAEGIDPIRITSEYDEELKIADRPLWDDDAVNPITDPTKNPPDVTHYPMSKMPTDGFITNVSPAAYPTAGETANNPVTIKIGAANGNQKFGGFTVKNSTPGKDRFVEIWVNGDVDLGGSTIQVEKGVHVRLYLNGDLNFRNRDINYVMEAKNAPEAGKTPADYSNQPADLLIFGMKEASATPAPKVDSSGNGHIVAAFYGPQYAGNLDGNTEIMGSFVLKTYNIAGGGGSGGDSVGAGLHYDEALGVVGPVKSYKAVSYFEDVRRDIDRE